MFDRTLLYRTRLKKFLLISFFLHLFAIVAQGLVPVRISTPPKPPPIKVNYVVEKETSSDLEKGTLIDAPKPKKIEKPKTSELLASYDSRAHSNLKKSPAKEYRRKKTVVPKSSGTAAINKKAQTQTRKMIAKKPRTKSLSSKNKVPLPRSVKGTHQPVASPQEQQVRRNQSAGTGGSLALLDGFDADKYASMQTDPKETEDWDDEEAVSLDTTETKYASYFARIKHQIERVWTYPVEAAQKGISGEMTLRFQISKDGNLLGVRVVQKSGHDILDYAAVKAVKGAAPFYPFPASIEKKKLSILATFIYSPVYGSAPRPR